MTTALALDLGFDRPPILGGAADPDASPRDHAPRGDRSSHSRLTLDDLVLGVW